MRPNMPYFPSGSAGAGLLLLRLSVALSLLLNQHFSNGPLFQQLAMVSICLGVVSGFHARLLAIACLALAGWSMAEAGGALSGFPAVIDALALALIGPGAISIDALRFGRRTIKLPRSNSFTGS